VVSPAESGKGVGGVWVVKIFLPSGAASVWFEGDFDREIDAYEAKRLDIEGAFVLSKNVPAKPMATADKLRSDKNDSMDPTHPIVAPHSF
jgi:hypothetical protein